MALAVNGLKLRPRPPRHGEIGGDGIGDG